MKHGGIVDKTLNNIVYHFSDLYSLHVHSYDYFKLGFLTNPKLVI